MGIPKSAERLGKKEDDKEKEILLQMLRSMNVNVRDPVVYELLRKTDLKELITRVAAQRDNEKRKSRYIVW